MTFQKPLLGLTFVLCITQQGVTLGQSAPPHAQGLQEELISVELDGARTQSGVYSTKLGSKNPTRLAVLLPGYPSVVRPVVSNGVMTESKLTGNFLIRARRFLVDESVASLIADCHSQSGDYCSSAYQSSQQRQSDLDRLIAEVVKQNPSIKEVWLVGTSMGTISSSFMPLHNPKGYSGAIHTAAITEPHAPNSYRELSNFDYKKSSVAQFFVHHVNDPCVLTTYSGAKSISEKFTVPLITVSGGSDFKGPACAAYTEHGFRGKELEVMTAINKILKTGAVSEFQID